MKVVLDTNVFISALNYSGNPETIFQLFLRGEIEVFISSFILWETQRILAEKFSWDNQRIEQTIHLLKRKAILINPQQKVSRITDKDDDNRILECALGANAQYIISGDKRHLLVLKEFRGIKIVSPAEFLDILKT
jgi:uncharacterized protein